MFDIQEELRNLPDKPGVYIMKDSGGNIIYVGKARVLKNRVRQYFQASARHSPKVAAMVEKISEFEYIVTDTELEALILECNLIKKFKPKFNILLRDDKNYPYIKLTMNEDYPRILMTRRVDKDGARYFGPYSNVFSVRETINLIKKIFPIKTCRRVLPRDFGKYRPCLNYHIKQCLAPCQGNVDREEYRAVMKDICSFLEGKQDAVISKLEKEMKEASDRLDFERAAAVRDKLSSLRHISEEQKVLTVAGVDRDIVGFASSNTDTCVQIFFIRGGKLLGREFFIIEGAGEAELKELASSFLKQFYSTAAVIPAEIIIETDFEDREVVEQWLSSQRGGKVHLKVPQKGEKLHMVEMVKQNARLELERFNEKLSGNGPVQRGLKEMSEMLGLQKIPDRIEAYDVSNTGASEIVSSMVVFEKGIPAKREYRHFKMRSVDIQNDYASMQETIFRRFRDKDKEKLPDLIMLDGGLGHVNAVAKVLDELNVNVPICGMVKDSKHKTSGLVLPDRHIDLSDNIDVLRLVTSIQDEAHRFALNYNKKLRQRRYRRSVLDQVEGIGPKRKKALLKHFGSVSNMKKAGIDDFQAVNGISRATAERLYEFLQSER